MTTIYCYCNSHELHFIGRTLSDIRLSCLLVCILQLTRFDTYMSTYKKKTTTRTHKGGWGKRIITEHSPNSPTRTSGFHRRGGSGKKKIQMKALFEITQQDIFKSILLWFHFFPSILNSAWWPTPLERTWRRVGNMLNPPSGVNNAGADCKSVYAPGGVNKGDCSELYFLFTHFCSAGWRSDVVYLKPCGWLACFL